MRSFIRNRFFRRSFTRNGRKPRSSRWKFPVTRGCSIFIAERDRDDTFVTRAESVESRDHRSVEIGLLRVNFKRIRHFDCRTRHRVKCSAAKLPKRV